MKREEVKKVYNSFEVVESISLNVEKKGEFIILLKRNQVRTYKLEFFLNGLLLKPENFHGKNIAYERWKELMETLPITKKKEKVKNEKNINKTKKRKITKGKR